MKEVIAVKSSDWAACQIPNKIYKHPTMHKTVLYRHGLKGTYHLISYTGVKNPRLTKANTVSKEEAKAFAVSCVMSVATSSCGDTVYYVPYHKMFERVTKTELLKNYGLEVSDISTEEDERLAKTKILDAVCPMLF